VQVGYWRELVQQEHLFDDVGGVKLWRKLHAYMRTAPSMGGF
jgi:hypothetical protein